MRPDPSLDLILARFVAACGSDDRVLGAFVSGSRATGKADEYSDLDLCLIARDDARDQLWAERAAFIQQLGEPLLLEDFDGTDTAYFILADGTEAELAFAREGHVHEVHRGPYRTLLDKTGVLAGSAFQETGPSGPDQVETLRRQIYWFWHDLSHFIAAVGRGQLWWGSGQIEALRRYCVDLARLREDFTEGPEGYDKLDDAVPGARLSALRPTFVPMERSAMLGAADAIVEFYRQLAPEMAEAHGLTYPIELDRLMRDRLAQLHQGAAPPRQR